MAGLKQLYLRDNHALRGTLPASMTAMKNLTRLNIGATALGGKVPALFGSLNHLTKLWFDATRMHGSLPPSLGSLRFLKSLKAGSNDITGVLPRSIGSLQNLLHMYCNDLHLSGLSSSQGHIDHHKNLTLLCISRCLLYTSDAADE